MLEKDIRSIQECLHAINSIQNYTHDILSLDALLADTKTYDAVLMNFIVLAESANRLSEEVKNKLNHIDWRAINGFRNFVAHDYFGIDENIVWAAIQFHIPELKAALKEIEQL